jgi:hypothetical protein
VPFFHDQGRDSLRRAYLDAWRKRREGRPLEPLEDQIATVIEQHPEYLDALGDESSVDRDYTPESGAPNPFLHMGLHLAIREQVATDRPPGIRAIHEALTRRLGAVHEAEHRMLERLGEALWLSQRSGLPPDEARYLESLESLLHRRK